MHAAHVWKKAEKSYKEWLQKEPSEIAKRLADPSEKPKNSEIENILEALEASEKGIALKKPKGDLDHGKEPEKVEEERR